ncbi:MAG TPA: hypothetical protein DIT04_03840 [Dysgonomonas sp.]|nr:hypothetical protein [Dysgonomonas sp.]
MFAALFFFPLIFLLLDFIHFVLFRKRFHKLMRLPFEITSLVIFPLLFFYLMFTVPVFDSREDYISQTESVTLFISAILYLPCIVSYFISNYTKQICTEIKYGILNLLNVTAILLNIILFIILYIKSDIIFPLIGNLPLIIAFGTTLLQNIHKQIQEN